MSEKIEVKQPLSQFTDPAKDFVHTIVPDDQFISGILDHENATEIMKLLERINALGTTVVVVTHSQEIVDQMGKRVITLNKGHLVSDERKGG